MVIALEPRLQAIVGEALKLATVRRNPALTLEHLMRAFLDDSEGARLLGELGVDVAEMRHELDEYLDLLEVRPPRRYHGPSEDRALRAAMRRSAVIALATRKPTISLNGLLVALVRDEESYPALLLHAAGLSPLDVLRHVSHGTHDFRLPETQAERLAVWVHNDDFTTMEFVVEVLHRVYRIAPEEAQRFMLIIHREGKAAVGEWPAEVSRRLTERALRLAEESGYPLRITVEEL